MKCSSPLNETYCTYDPETKSTSHKIDFPKPTPAKNAGSFIKNDNTAYSQLQSVIRQLELQNR